MKRYTVCAAILVCVACSSMGCGKTEYNEYWNKYAEYKLACQGSGGMNFEFNENGDWTCQCNAQVCHNQICNDETKECGECRDGEEKCDSKSGKYLICEGKKWQDSGDSCIIGGLDTQQACDENEAKVCGEDNHLHTCIKGQKYIVECKDGCDSEKLECISNCDGDYPRCAGDSDYLEICREGKKERIFCPFACDAEKSECKASTSSSCNDGEEKCQVSYYGKPVHFKCMNNAWEVFEVCPSDSCDAQMLACGCTDGQSVCDADENIVKRCQNDQGYTHWVQEDFKFGCDEEGNSLISCDNGVISETKCPLGCSGDACNECLSGLSVCNANNDKLIDICVDGHWQSEDCKHGCNSGANACYGCPKDETYERCSEDNSALLKCEKGVLSEEKCQLGCSNDACDVCSSGATLCSESDPNQIEKCVDGQWVPEDCPHGCNSGANACYGCPKDKTYEQCSGNTLLKCEKGVLSEEKCQLGCSNDACNVCSSGATQCSESDPNQIEKCVNGQWVSEAEDNKCDNGCEDGKCKCSGEESYCKGDTLVRCINNYINKTKCEYGCINGKCADSCVKGKVKCDFDEDGKAFLYECNDNQRWKKKSSEPCSSGYCDVDRPSCGCSPGADILSCDDNNKFFTSHCEQLDGGITKELRTEFDVSVMCRNGVLYQCKDKTISQHDSGNTCSEDGRRVLSCDDNDPKIIECPLGCTDGRCNVCINREFRCTRDEIAGLDANGNVKMDDNGNVIFDYYNSSQVCKNGAWEYRDTCTDVKGICHDEIMSFAVCNSDEELLCQSCDNDCVDNMIVWNRSAMAFAYCSNNSINKWIDIKDAEHWEGKPKFLSLVSDAFDNCGAQGSFSSEPRVCVKKGRDVWPGLIMAILGGQIPCYYGVFIDDEHPLGGVKNSYICYSECLPDEVRCLNDTLQRCVTEKIDGGLMYTKWKDVVMCVGGQCSTEYLGCIKRVVDDDKCLIGPTCKGQMLSVCSNSRKIEIQCPSKCNILSHEIGEVRSKCPLPLN